MLFPLTASSQPLLATLPLTSSPGPQVVVSSEIVRKSEAEWPAQPVSAVKFTADLEQKNTAKYPVALATVMPVDDDEETPWRLDPARFFSLRRLVQQCALVIPFIENSLKKRSLCIAIKRTR